MDAANKDSGHSGNWNWLDQWMEERYWDTRQVSKAMDDEKYTKILEVDTCKPPQFNSRRRANHLQYACSPTNSNQNSRNLASVPDFASKDSTTARLSVPSPSSFDDRHESPSPLRLPIVVEPVNMGESPQFFSAASRPGSSRRSPFTPAKSECSLSLFSGYRLPQLYGIHRVIEAKVRSQSAPKQRPECEKSSWIKRPSAHGFVDSRLPLL
ncbi:hypothetical protein HPP92_022364 [Vanilla planifolia]|uniref:Uncharacterized protein n=1 Tax=Vanilla planifolia TaxID=51239 RepID=A0A835UD52_VANPL|nr:hypothetical protein HPP92_022364 [Vanilla planifolia]